jgi:hypothetical protein
MHPAKELINVRAKFRVDHDPTTTDFAGRPVHQIKTGLYDKRQMIEFRELHDRSPLARFPHITSNLAALCKYNILKAQFIRFIRIITERAAFASELASVIVELARRGYRFSWLWKDADTLLSTRAAFTPSPRAPWPSSGHGGGRRARGRGRRRAGRAAWAERSSRRRGLHPNL